MKNKQPIIRALDIGYGAVKFVRGMMPNGKPLVDVFPSIIKQLDSSHHLNLMGHRDTCRVTIDDTTYEAGKDMDAAFDGGSNRILNSNYINSNEYKVLFQTALYYMDSDSIDLLVVGLPVSYMDTKAEFLRELFVGTHTVMGKTKEVKDIHVIPQPIGGFMSTVQAKNLSPAIVKAQRNLLIDPGFFTVDYVAARGMKEINSISGSPPYGMHTLINRICELISKDLNIIYDNISSVDEGLYTGNFTLYGKKIDLKKYAKKASSVFQPAIEDIKNQIGDGREFDKIVLVGGGAQYFEAPLKKAFPNITIEQCASPQTANVLGFQFIGELKLNCVPSNREVRDVA